MARTPCRPLGWILRHRDTKLWYTGSSGANQKRTQNWSDRPYLAKKYNRACDAQSAGMMIGQVIGEEKTNVYLLVHDGEKSHYIRFSRDRASLVEHNFALNIRNPYKPLDNPVNK